MTVQLRSHYNKHVHAHKNLPKYLYVWVWSINDDQDQDSLLMKGQNDNHSPGSDVT